MAFAGYLIKLKKISQNDSDEELPLEYMAVDSYDATPNQRMEVKANRAVTGKLVRNNVAHTATKIEFETPPCTNREAVALNTLLQAHFTNTLERAISIEYYDNETDSYKTGDFYMPDTQYKISRIDNVANIIYYDKIRYAFIEY